MLAHKQGAQTMQNIKTDWRLVKSPFERGRWDIETRLFLRNIAPDGAVSWELIHNWRRHSTAASKRAALARVMLLRERGEIVTWSGPAMRLGLALIEPHALTPSQS